MKNTTKRKVKCALEQPIWAVIEKGAVILIDATYTEALLFQTSDQAVIVTNEAAQRIGISQETMIVRQIQKKPTAKIKSQSKAKVQAKQKTIKTIKI